jgi:hypothetical protein
MDICLNSGLKIIQSWQRMNREFPSESQKKSKVQNGVTFLSGFFGNKNHNYLE